MQYPLLAEGGVPQDSKSFIPSGYRKAAAKGFHSLELFPYGLFAGFRATIAASLAAAGVHSFTVSLSLRALIFGRGCYCAYQSLSL